MPQQCKSVFSCFKKTVFTPTIRIQIPQIYQKIWIFVSIFSRKNIFCEKSYFLEMPYFSRWIDIFVTKFIKIHELFQLLLVKSSQWKCNYWFTHLSMDTLSCLFSTELLCLNVARTWTSLQFVHVQVRTSPTSHAATTFWSRSFVASLSTRYWQVTTLYRVLHAQLSEDAHSPTTESNTLF